MDFLRAALKEAGLEHVSTYLQSGNVLWEGPGKDAAAKRIAQGLRALGLEVAAVIRSSEELQRIAVASPFGGDGSDDSHRFVTFLSEAATCEVPKRSARGDWEVLLQTDWEVYSVARLIDGRYGAPNGPIEAKLGAPATTRNWTVLQAVTGLLCGKGSGQVKDGTDLLDPPSVRPRSILRSRA